MFYVLSKVAWFFATPSNLLVVLVLLGLALQVVPRLRGFGLGLSALAALTILFAGLSPLANWMLLPLEERFPVFADDGRPVDGVIVLGGAVLAEESLGRGQLILNDAGERAVALADLSRRYPDARTVFSGGGGTLLEDEAAEAGAVRRFAGALGIDPDRILVEDRSRTTEENAAFSKALVEPKPGERWLLVTSAWHMPRAVGCFRQAGFGVTAYPVDFRTRGASDARRPFAFVSDGLRRVDVAAREWAGLLAYRLAGRVPELFPGPEPASDDRSSDGRSADRRSADGSARR
jgi:uncharacterized SAM-binding protein YcdF (DUF218 family)